MSEQTPIPDLINGVVIPDELWDTVRRAWDESCGPPSVITKVALAYGVAVGGATAAKPLLDLISDFAGFGTAPCSYDHHGNCQEHGWTTTDPRCPFARAKELLAEKGDDRG